MLRLNSGLASPEIVFKEPIGREPVPAGCETISRNMLGWDTMANHFTPEGHCKPGLCIT